MPYAQDAEQQTGIPALFALSQSALESGWGKHAPGNMLFGMKRGSGKSFGGWQGDTQLITTREYSSKADRKYPYVFPGYPIFTGGKWKYKIKDHFRAYPTPLHSFLDWSGLLSKSPRYAKAMNRTENPYRFAEEVAKAGYATSPTYAAKVKRLMNEIAGSLGSSVENKASNRTRFMFPFSLVLLGLGIIVIANANTKP